MLILAGLGNPGASYARHRHNIGFMLVDRIQEDHRLPPWRRKFDALVTEGNLGGEKVLLIKPQTYMNRSGQAIGQAMRFFKLTLDQLLVVHDELDLAPFKVRVKKGGGVAGHNGLKSIAAHLQSRDFKRVRIGIGHPGDRSKVHNHVLGDFSKAESGPLETLIDVMSRHAPLLVSGDESGYMNRIALALNPPPPRPPRAAGNAAD